jgi:hypothetical protein
MNDSLERDHENFPQAIEMKDFNSYDILQKNTDLVDKQLHQSQENPNTK